MAITPSMGGPPLCGNSTWGSLADVGEVGGHRDARPAPVTEATELVAAGDAEAAVAVDELLRTAGAGSPVLADVLLRSDRRPNSVTSIRPSSIGDDGVVADEPGEASRLDGRGEQDQVATRTVGTQQLRSEPHGVDGVLETRFVVVEVLVEFVEFGLEPPEQPGRLDVVGDLAEIGEAGLHVAQRLFDGSNGVDVDGTVDDAQRFGVDLAERRDTSPVASLAAAARSAPADTFCATPGTRSANLPSGPPRRRSAAANAFDASPNRAAASW